MYESSILWFIPADAVFCESSEERTSEDKQIRAKKTFEEMMKYLPGQVSQHFEEMNVGWLQSHSCQQSLTLFRNRNTDVNQTGNLQNKNFR